MKILLPVLICLLALTGSAQRRKTVIKTKKASSSANSILDDIKKLSPAQKSFCFNVIEKLNTADAGFQTARDFNRFNADVKLADDFYQSRIGTLPKGKIKAAMNILILNYKDAAMLLKLTGGDERANLTPAQKENLSAVYKKYKTFLNIDSEADLLKTDNVNKMYESAVKSKEILFIVLH